MKRTIILLLVCLTGICVSTQAAAFQHPDARALPVPHRSQDTFVATENPQVSATVAESSPATYPEPEFVGQVLAVLPGDKTTQLIQESLIPRDRATTTATLFGIGKIKKEMTLNSPRAIVRLKDNDGIALIVRVFDNQADPMSEIMIFRFETTKKRRQAEYASIGTFGDTQSNSLQRQPFTARKFGRNSYMIVLQGAQPGEYGIIVNGTSDLTVSTFGVE